MTRLAVDPTALPAIATAVRRAADIADSAASEHRSLPVASLAGLADPVLIAALGRFTDGWSPRLDDLADDAHRLADALDVAARLYQDTEIAAQVAVASPVGALRAAPAEPRGGGAP